MKKAEGPVEKRSHNRFQAKDGVYAIINYKPVIFGQIINISKDGMAVRYSSNGQQSSVSSELDVFIMDSNFYIEKIQIKIVSDFEVGGKSLLSSQTNRQRCFQFGRMKSSQHFQLDYLLQNHTKKDALTKTIKQSDDRQI
jgi:tRNA/tmRNA/rRNA uracil-C5-methylase (TrmA/RlmC/RlmD family)